MAAPGDEAAAAGAISGALAGRARPADVLAFDGVPVDDHWPAGQGPHHRSGQAHEGSEDCGLDLVDRCVGHARKIPPDLGRFRLRLPPFHSRCHDDHMSAPEISLPTLVEDRFLDRELSWLHFNTRVLELAEDDTLPLLERVRYLEIFSSNLDEFFMVRVAGLKRRIAAGVAVRAASGLMPRDVLEQIWSTTGALMQRQAALFRAEIVPALAKEDIELLRWADLSREEQKQLKKQFKERLFPVLTPLAVDPAHPFPYISGLSLNLAVLVRNPATGKEHFARVKVPPIFSRFVAVAEQRFVPL